MFNIYAINGDLVIFIGIILFCYGLLKFVDYLDYIGRTGKFW